MSRANARIRPAERGDVDGLVALDPLGRHQFGNLQRTRPCRARPGPPGAPVRASSSTRATARARRRRGADRRRGRPARGPPRRHRRDRPHAGPARHPPARRRRRRRRGIGRALLAAAVHLADEQAWTTCSHRGVVVPRGQPLPRADRFRPARPAPDRVHQRAAPLARADRRAGRMAVLRRARLLRAQRAATSRAHRAAGQARRQAQTCPTCQSLALRWARGYFGAEAAPARRALARLPRVLRPARGRDVDHHRPAHERGVRLHLDAHQPAARRGADARRRRLRCLPQDVPPRGLRRVQGRPQRDARRLPRPGRADPHGARRAAHPCRRSTASRPTTSSPRSPPRREAPAWRCSSAPATATRCNWSTTTSPCSTRAAASAT